MRNTAARDEGREVPRFADRDPGSY